MNIISLSLIKYNGALPYCIVHLLLFIHCLVLETYLHSGGSGFVFMKMQVLVRTGVSHSKIRNIYC